MACYTHDLLYSNPVYIFVEFRGRHGNRHSSPGRQKNKGSKNTIVMLEDIKAVAYDQLVEQMQKPIAPDFDSIIFKYVYKMLDMFNYPTSFFSHDFLFDQLCLKSNTGIFTTTLTTCNFHSTRQRGCA